MKLSRAQILTKFDLKPRTLEVLLGSLMLDSKFESKHGRRLMTVNGEQKFLLSCAQNYIDSFSSARFNHSRISGIPSLPFHRFLALRFLTTPLDEIFEEIFLLNLLPSKARFKKETFKKLYARFLKRIPAELKSLVKGRKAPKTKKEKLLYDALLSVLNIYEFYHRPEYVDQLMFFSGMKKKVELFLSTTSSSSDIAKFLTKQTGVPVKEKAISAFRMLFYSIREISDHDLEAYFAMIQPSERKGQREAMSKSINQLAMSLGVEHLGETRDVLEGIKRQALKELSQHMGWKTAESRQAQRAAFDRWLKADERLESIGGDVIDITRIFEKFTIKKVDRTNEIISIEEVKGEGRRRASGDK